MLLLIAYINWQYILYIANIERPRTAKHTGSTHHRHRLEGEGDGGGVGDGDVEGAGEVLELEGRGSAVGVGGHGEVEDLVAVAVGAVVIVAGEVDGDGVAREAGADERGGVYGAVDIGKTIAADVGAVVAARDGGGGAVEADLVAGDPRGVGTVEEHLAAGHRFGEDFHHAVDAVVHLFAPCQSQQGKQSCQNVCFFHSV